MKRRLFCGSILALLLVCLRYALAANVASFGVGLILARLIPGMF